jgi:hypothetical protein
MRKESLLACRLGLLEMVAGRPICFPIGFRSKDFAVSHSPAWANATAAAIAWNLSLQNLILDPRLISIRLPISSIK